MSKSVFASLTALTLVACRSHEAESPPAAELANFAPAAATAGAADKTAKDAAPAVTDDLELSGVAAPMRSTRLSPKAGGILASIKTREGTYVEAGQVLCQLDPIDVQIRLDGAKVALDQALAAAQNAASDLRRAKELFKGGSMTDQGVEKAQFAARIADLQVDGAKVALHAAQQALADTALRAPFAGVVTKVLAEEGQMITTMPPALIFALADTLTLEVRVSVPERMLARIKVGQPVTVILPAVNAERKAQIDRIPEVVDSTTRSVEAVIRLDNKDRALPAGLYARVRFTGIKVDAADTAVAADAGPQRP